MSRRTPTLQELRVEALKASLTIEQWSSAPNEWNIAIRAELLTEFLLNGKRYALRDEMNLIRQRQDDALRSSPPEPALDPPRTPAVHATTG